MKVKQEQVETLTVEMRREDVRSAVTFAARESIRAEKDVHGDVDDRFTAQVVEDGCGGFVVSFRKGTSSIPKAA